MVNVNIIAVIPKQIPVLFSSSSHRFFFRTGFSYWFFFIFFFTSSSYIFFLHLLLLLLFLLLLLTDSCFIFLQVQLFLFFTDYFFIFFFLFFFYLLFYRFFLYFLFTCSSFIFVFTSFYFIFFLHILLLSSSYRLAKIAELKSKLGSAFRENLKSTGQPKFALDEKEEAVGLSIFKFNLTKLKLTYFTFSCS